MSIMDSIYYKINKKVVDRAILKLKKIPVDVVYEILLKNCLKEDVECELILKTKTELEIKLNGKKESSLFKFHKSFVVFKEDYEKIISIADSLEINKCIYITTGVFHSDVYKCNAWSFSKIKFKLEDNIKFIKRQIWLNKDYIDHFKYKRLDFTKYLPN